MKMILKIINLKEKEFSDRYEGEWKNDLKEGKGIMHYSNGNKEEGIWKNNKLEIN